MEAWKEELYHFGTKEHSGRYPWGSGNRPYQRYALSSHTKRKIRKEKVEKAFARNIKQGKDKPNVSPAESVVKSSKRIIDDSGDIARKIDDIRYRKRDRELREKFQNEASNMSNKELSDIINRMNLEDAYVNKKTSRYSRGKSKALEVLDITGDFASIGLSVASILGVIYAFKTG